MSVIACSQKFERVNNLGAYSIRLATVLLIPSAIATYDHGPVTCITAARSVRWCTRLN
jgi:hypothetical protein